MTVTRLLLSAVAGMGLLDASLADTHYVAQNGQAPVSDYTNGWPSAASNIQDAVDASTAGDTVLVSNGVYNTGGACASGALITNRVYINKAISVRSFNNDPTNTIIKGAWDPDANGPGPAAVRCVYMVSGASLIGFTLTNGGVMTGYDYQDVYGGGVRGGLASNCVIAGNTAWLRGAGAAGTILIDCTVIGNKLTSGYNGGACVDCVARNCIIVSNYSLGSGAGCGATTLFNCTIAGNRGSDGGGCVGSTLSNCTISGNSAGAPGSGGGVYGCILYNCTLSNNGNCSFGGGAYNSTLYNCLIIGNEVNSISSGRDGGGANACVLYNCTVVGNKSAQAGGGVAGCTSINSIVYFNTAKGSESNYSGTVYFTNSCTAPTVTGWAAGNITNNPMFVDQGNGYGLTNIPGNYRLEAESPCMNTGTNFAWMTDPADGRSKDLDGRPRINGHYTAPIVDMGCYEFISRGTVMMFR